MKPPPADSIQSLTSGGGACASLLSPRQLEVLEMIGHGYTSKEIAHLMKLSPDTVASYRKAICKKLNAHSTAALIALAIGGW
jgi:DNA-binding CsgD family transcriptional regulator